MTEQSPRNQRAVQGSVASRVVRAIRPTAAVAGARLARVVSGPVGHGGTSLPGLVANAVDPTLAGGLASELGAVVLVVGTNGKTTTAHLIDQILEKVHGTAPIANRSGANLRQGIVTALVGASTLRGRLVAPGRAAVFEVDEMALESVVASVNPTVIVALNLFRDQLDRYGEVDAIVDRWASVVARLPSSTTLVYCADDPRLENLARTAKVRLLRFGLDGRLQPADSVSHAATMDPVGCPVCRAPLTAAWRSVGHLGDFRCPNGHFARQPLDIAVAARPGTTPGDARLRFTGSFGEAEVDLALPGTSGAYDAAAAVAAAMALGVAPHRAVECLVGATPAFGRLEVTEWLGRRIILMLVKNAASLTESAEIACRLQPEAILVGLNDRPADGRDVSWIWDADFAGLEQISAIGLTGSRASDLAVRIKYEGRVGNGGRPLIACPPEPGAALQAMVGHVPSGATVVVLATYTALLAARAALERQGLVGPMPA